MLLTEAGLISTTVQAMLYGGCPLKSRCPATYSSSCLIRIFGAHVLTDPEDPPPQSTKPALQVYSHCYGLYSSCPRYCGKRQFSRVLIHTHVGWASGNGREYRTNMPRLSQYRPCAAGRAGPIFQRCRAAYIRDQELSLQCPNPHP